MPNSLSHRHFYTTGTMLLLCLGLLTTSQEAATDGLPLTEPKALASVDGLLDITLIQRAGTAVIDGRTIRNVWTYHADQEAAPHFPGPTLYVKRGDTLKIKIVNRLSQVTAALSPPFNAPFDAPTNLHLHGLHVSPLGNNDNVLICIPAEGSNQYVFHIPDNQPDGLYWYHPHMHEFVDDQVFRGLCGMLVILYGKYVEDGTIPLGKTLRELELTDVDGLLPRELEATIEHLITARSGVYHPASNAGDSTDSAPPRGSQQPGTYYLYNNWDFNAAGAVFEKLTGRNIYDVLESDLARPIGMQDFDRIKQRKSGDPKRSQHLAYHMWISTRDMARVGLLMLRGGAWNGQQVASRDWVKRISGLVTPFHEMNPPQNRALGSGNRWGYGAMWWVWDAPNSSGPYQGAFTGMGAGGQFITILPQLDMVVAHKTDIEQVSAHGPGERRRTVSGTEYDAILRMLLASRCPGGKCPQ